MLAMSCYQTSRQNNFVSIQYYGDYIVNWLLKQFSWFHFQCCSYWFLITNRQATSNYLTTKPHSHAESLIILWPKFYLALSIIITTNLIQKHTVSDFKQVNVFVFSGFCFASFAVFLDVCATCSNHRWAERMHLQQAQLHNLRQTIQDSRSEQSTWC